MSYQNALHGTINTFIMPGEPNNTVPKRSEELNDGQDGELDECSAQDRTFPQLLTNPEIGIK